MSGDGHPIVFTDLDGTLLDWETRNPGPAASVIHRLQERRIPIIFCSAKTRAEQEVIRPRLGIRDPFIVENGGAVYFSRDASATPVQEAVLRPPYVVRVLGKPYDSIRDALKRVRAETGIPVRGFGDMTDAEVAALTGLGVEAARRARSREYDETLAPLDPAHVPRLIDALARRGLQCVSGGRLLHVSGNNDKGRAVQLVSNLYAAEFGKIVTFGLGDGWNDAPMFAEVDQPVLVQQPGGRWESIEVPGLYRQEGVGPVGWVAAVERFVLR